jgi:PKD repeat protein
MKRFLYFTMILPMLFLASCEKSPRAQFHTDTDNFVVGQEILFYNDSENSESYDWDFGDGYASSERSPYHTFNSNGTFEVVLTAVSKNGNEDKSSMTITVKIPTLLEIEVREYYEDYAVSNASVLLYESLADWDAADISKSILEGITDKDGITVFANLDPYVYYVDVWEKGHDNYQLGSEDVGFIRTPEVMPNRINRFLALVDKADHTQGKGLKSAAKIVKIIRKPSDHKQPASGDTEGWKELYDRRVNK